MDVYVIPIGRERYELYCEVAEDPEAANEPPPSGMIAKVRHRFRALLRAAEERRHRHTEPEPEPEAKGWVGRTQDRIMAWVAERIAEQRLLWNLRHHSTAIAVHPDDMTADQVTTLVRRTLRRDYERHRRWMIVDGIAFLFTFIVLGPLFLLIPGVANLPAAYFAFRVVGHWLSMRGSTQGLERVTWGHKPCPPLTELRDAVALEPGPREQHIHAIAARLRLQHLPTFFEQVAVWNA